MRFRGLIPFALALLTPTPVVAQDKADEDVETAKPAPSPVSSLAHVTERIAQILPASASDALVVAAPLKTDTKAPRGAELAARVAEQVAGRHQNGWRSAPKAMPLEEARGAARRADRLVYLRIEIDRGSLAIAADIYPIPKSVWSRARNPTPGPVAHAFARAPLDAELRTFLEPIPLSAWNVTRARNFESSVLALDCDDIDQDGQPEVLVVSRSRVSIVRLRKGEVVAVRSRPWSELSPIHPTPLQEPIGFAQVGFDGDRSARVLYASSTDRQLGLKLSPTLEVLEELDGLVLPDGENTQCGQLIDLAVTGPVRPCGAAGPRPRTPSVGGRYDAFASADIVRQDGRVDTLYFGREDRVLEMLDANGGKRRYGGVGAQLAASDIDQDGAVEIISGLDVVGPGQDAIRIAKVSTTGKLEEIGRLPAGAGVHAVAACPATGPGRSPFVVATADEIWLVQ